MSDESFEIINKKNEMENGENGKENASGSVSRGSWLTDVAPPSDLPNFVPVSSPASVSSNKESTNLFHPTSFSPAIPESKAQSFSNQVETEESVSVGLFEWVKDTVGNKGTNLFTKVAEKAKSSVDSVINALDPQLGDLSGSRDDLEIIVASEKEIVVSAVREAFQLVFNRISVRGLDTEDVLHAKQVVGFEAASKVCALKADYLQGRYSLKGLVITCQDFIIEAQEEKWYDLDLMVLNDFEKPLCLETYTQMTPIPYSVIHILKEDTPKDYQHTDTGFGISVAQILASNLQVHPSEWQETLTGISRKDKLRTAAHMLVNLYKNTLP